MSRYWQSPQSNPRLDAQCSCGQARADWLATMYAPSGASGAAAALSASGPSEAHIAAAGAAGRGHVRGAPGDHNASEELTQRGELHGYVLSSLRDGAEVERALLPVISMTKIAGCHGDLVAPPWYHSQHLAGLRRQPEGFWAYARRLVGLGGWGAGSPGSDADPDALPWEQRVPRLFFRGSTTGGGFKVGTPYERFHRHRLVELAANDSRMDIGFTNFLQARAPVPTV